jgi:hypothetical protein
MSAVVTQFVFLSTRQGWLLPFRTDKPPGPLLRQLCIHYFCSVAADVIMDVGTQGAKAADRGSDGVH